MTLTEFHAATKDLPGDAELFVDHGDLRFAEVRHHVNLPPVPTHPWAVILELGPVRNDERDLDARFEAHLD